MNRACLFLLLMLGSHTFWAQLPDGFSDEAINGPWDIPIGITFDENGNGYIWASTGKVYFMDTTEQVHPTPILDISEEVGRWLDHGMLGFCLDPNFIQNGKVYLLYTVDRHHLYYYGTPEYDPGISVTHQATIGRLSRYQLDLSGSIPSTIPESRKVLIGNDPQNGFPVYYASHGVGGLCFGTDGSLLVSCGESGSSISIDNGSDDKTDFAQALEEGILKPKENVGAFKAQLIDNLNGKILRIDPETGYGLASNPFYDPSKPDAARSKVFALGLRNPWRITLIPETGSHNPADGNPGYLLIGDVGDGAWEELNLLNAAGQNFGWPLYEGFEYHPELHPLTTYNQDAGNPLAGQACPDYFSFQDLLLPAGSNLPTVNPCDTQYDIINTPVFIHRPPLLAYRNQNDTSTPLALYGAADGQSPVPLDIEEAGLGSHFQGDASMAGIIYQGRQFPDQYHGLYFHADYRGWIRCIQMADDGSVENITPFHEASEKIVSLAEHPRNGYLYYINLEDKKLHRVKYGGPPIPMVIAEAYPQWGPAPLTVLFDGSQSFSTGSPLRYYWDFGDGSTDSASIVSHTYTNTSGLPESFNARLMIRDTFGQQRSRDINISINNTAPELQITHPLDSSFYPMTQTSLLRLEALVEDAEHAADELEYEWQVYLHHNDHFHPSSASSSLSSYALLSPLGCHTDEYWYRINLKVTDPNGASSSSQIVLLPDCNEAFIEELELQTRYHEQGIQLTWESLSTNELERFEIERSSDFFHYSSLGQLGSQEHIFIDQAPILGPNVYRIKAISTTGAFYYSPISALDYPVDVQVKVFPNPASQAINIEIAQALADKLEITIFGPEGRLLQKMNLPAEYGKTFVHELDINNLPIGQYYLLLQNGLERRINAFIKQ